MMRMETGRPSLSTRAVAALAAALVLALAVLAASPELHERLHGHGPAAAGAAHRDGAPSGARQAADDEDGCVVTLFAQGVVLALAVAVTALWAQAPRSPILLPSDRVIPAAPRYLRLPSQAPPVGMS